MTATNLLEVIIDRSKWARGPDDPKNPTRALLGDDRKMCCLGFVARALGATSRQIDGRAMPSDAGILCLRPLLVQKRKWYDTALARAASRENDSRVPDDIREAHLTSLFRKHNVTIRFVDRAPRKKTP